MEYQGTGIEFPKITLGGVEYELKFTRGALLYRISRKGIAMADLSNANKRFACLFDILHAIISDKFSGTADDLASMAYEEDGKMKEIDAAVSVALGKAFPSTQPAQATAVNAPQVQ